MIFTLEDGTLFLDQHYFCKAEPGNGRQSLPAGLYPVRVDFAAEHLNAELPYADGLGWIGGTPQQDIVVGIVRGRSNVLPCRETARSITKSVARSLKRGEDVFIEVKNG